MQYFKHELTTRDDDGIFELIEAHGISGYGLWWVILEELYKAEAEGFQITASETWFKRISKDLNITDYRTPIRILDTMAELRLIDPQMWAEHIILAPGIQKRADSYIRQKELAAKRKREQRERDRLAREAAKNEKPQKKMSRVTDAGQVPCHTTVTTNTDPDPYSDPDPETDSNTDPFIYPDPERESERKQPVFSGREELTGVQMTEARFGNPPLPKWRIGAGPNDWNEEVLSALVDWMNSIRRAKGQQEATRADAVSYIAKREYPGSADYPGLVSRVDELMATAAKPAAKSWRKRLREEKLAQEQASAT